MPIFFVTNKNGLFPFDIFASSFFLLTRYEEALPHLKTDLGHFNFFDSIAHKNNFLEKPIIDIWVFKFFKILSKIFEEISQFDRGKPSKELLLEVHIPYKYRHRSFLIILGIFFFFMENKYERFGRSNFSIVKNKKRSLYSFDTWSELFENSSRKPKVFFICQKFILSVDVFNFQFQL